MTLWQGHLHDFAVQRQGTEGCRRLLEALGSDPDRLLREGRIVKPGSRTHAGIVTIAGREYFLKRYNDRGWWYRLRHVFLISRALRTWRIHWKMFCCGLPVPEPYVCLVERRYGLLRRSYILMEYAGGTVSLDRAWPHLTDEQRCASVTLAGSVLGRFHRTGIVHRDYKWSNLMVSRDAAVQRMTVVDLDASRPVNSLTRGRLAKDVDRFLKDLPADARVRELRDHFLYSWRRAYNDDPSLP